MASEVKHTPGPWKLEEIRTDSGRAFRIGAGDMLRAGKGCCIIYDDYPGNPENERKANARLIAAAPELLEAGSDVIREFDNIYDVDDGRANVPGDLMALVDKLRAVVAKAEGK